MGKQIVFPLIVVFIAVIVAAALGANKSRRKEGKYRARQLLTDNELEFFDRLVHALPEHYIFPQVAMSALLEASSGDRKQAYSDHLRIAQQRVDYVICDSQCNVIAVVELDDKTHSRAKDGARDGRLQQGAIRTIRFQSRNKPTIDSIRAAVLPTPSDPQANIGRTKQGVQETKHRALSAVKSRTSDASLPHD